MGCGCGCSTCLQVQRWYGRLFGPQARRARMDIFSKYGRDVKVSRYVVRPCALHADVPDQGVPP